MVLTCSTRPGAVGPIVSRWFTHATKELADELGADLVPVSLAEQALPMLDEEEHPASGRYAQAHTREWAAKVASVDGFVIVTPEYNYGMTAALKNALDYLSAEWAWKPTGFVSYGNTSAGTRSVQHIKQVTTSLRLVPTAQTVALRLADTVRDGRMIADPARDAAACALLEETIRLSASLAPMRHAQQAVRGPIPMSLLRPLSADDAGDVLVLQRCCWLDEARANNTMQLAALQETYDDVAAWLSGPAWQSWGLWLGGRLVGMIRMTGRNGQWRIGRLATAPDLRGRGVGAWLLAYAESLVEPACSTMSLTTGAGSASNIAMYQARGWTIAATSDTEVTLHKPTAHARRGSAAR